jgi:hypothetical protein
MSQVTYVKELCRRRKWSCHIHESSNPREGVMSHKAVILYIWKIHVAYMNEAYMYDTREWVTSHICMRHTFTTRVNESCHTHEWGIHAWHPWMSHVTRMNEAYMHDTREGVISHAWMRHTRTTHVKESYHTHEWGIHAWHTWRSDITRMSASCCMHE